MFLYACFVYVKTRVRPSIQVNFRTVSIFRYSELGWTIRAYGHIRVCLINCYFRSLKLMDCEFQSQHLRCSQRSNNAPNRIKYMFFYSIHLRILTRIIYLVVYNGYRLFKIVLIR